MQDKNVREVSAFNNELKLKGFNVFQIESDGAATRIYSRKDFYKICLTTGKSIIHYADRSFEEDGTVLFLAIRTFLIPGRHFQPAMSVIQFCFQRSFSNHLTVPKTCNTHHFLKLAVHQF